MEEGSRLGAIALAVALLALGLLAFAPSASAEEHPARAFLYLNGDTVGQETYEEVYDEVLCRDVPIHAMSTAAPTTAEHEAVGGSPMYGPVTACSINFVYTVEETFTFQHGGGFTFWLGCHAPFFGVSKKAAGETPLPDVRVSVTRNGEDVATGEATVPAALVGVCEIPGLVDGPFRLDAVFEEHAEVRFDPGDELWAWLWIDTSPDPEGEIAYVAVNSTRYPSALHAPGLPGPLRAGFDTTILADVPTRSQAAGPGNATSYPITLQNVGDDPREVGVSVTGEDGWAAIPDPFRVTVPAGGTAEVNVTLRAPVDATVGSQAEHAIALVPDDEDPIRLATTTHVLPGEGFPLLLPGEEIETSDTGAVQRLGDVFSEVWVEAVATAIVGAVVTVAHVVRKGAL